MLIVSGKFLKRYFQMDKIMERLLEQEFLEIVSDFGSEESVREHKLHFSVLGSPLRHSRYLLIGDSWEITGEIETQVHMPLVSDILANPRNKAYRGYINFFNVMFNGNSLKTLELLNKAVFTNGNWIRTPHEGKEHAEELAIGRELSKTYLKAIINLVRPEVIICFGNSEFSATSSVFKALGETKNFWEIEDRHYEPTINNWSTYEFSIYQNSHHFKVFSFPNSSKFHIWNANIEDNEVFIHLKSMIEQNLVSAGF